MGLVNARTAFRNGFDEPCELQRTIVDPGVYLEEPHKSPELKKSDYLLCTRTVVYYSQTRTIADDKCQGFST